MQTDIKKHTERTLVMIYIVVVVCYALLHTILGIVIDMEAWSSLQQETYQTVMNGLLYVLMAMLMIRAAKVYFIHNQWPLFFARPRFSYGMVLLTLLLMFGFSFFINQWFQLFRLSGLTENESAIRTMIQSRWYNAWMVFFMIVIFAPIVEELVFRKGLYHIIQKRLGHLAAILLNALPFALIHMLTELDNVAFILPYYGMGVMLSFGYYYSGRLIFVPIVAHAVMNLITFLAIIFVF